jgi:hypothetical protein
LKRFGAWPVVLGGDALAEAQTKGQEVLKVAVVGEQNGVIVDAALSNQGVHRACFEGLLQEAAAHFSGAFPIAVDEREDGQLVKMGFVEMGARVTEGQQLGENRRGHRHNAMLKKYVELIGCYAGCSAEEIAPS